MKNKFVNLGVLISNLKRFWVIPTIITIILFIAIPFSMLQKANTKIDTNTSAEATKYIQKVIKNNLNNPINALIIFIVPLAISIQVFKYANKNNSTTFMHSLPLSKKNLYFTNILSGLILLILPYLLNAVIMLLINSMGGFGAYLELTDILIWLGVNSLFNLVFFAFSTMCGMCCGMGISHTIITYLFMYLPIGFVYIFELFLKRIVLGFSGFGDSLAQFFMALPFVKVITGYYALTAGSLEIKYIICYAVLAIIFITIGLIVYKIRKLEKTKEFIVFRTLREILKYVGTFTIMELAYIYYYLLNPQEIQAFLFGLSIALVAYLVIEMILRKTYKVLKSIKGFIIYTVIMSILFAIVSFDVIGFENRVPQLSEVETVTVEKINYSNNENIQTVIDLQKALIEKASVYNYYNELPIKYKLKNGKQIERCYYITESDEEYKNIELLEKSDEYIYQKYNYLFDDELAKQIEEFEIKADLNNKNISISVSNLARDEEAFNNILNAIKKDIKESKVYYYDKKQEYGEYDSKYLYVYINSTGDKNSIGYYKLGSNIELVKYINQLVAENSKYIEYQNYSNK